MECFAPLKANRATDGSISFSNLEGSNLSLPCGQCMGCRIQRTQMWTIRMLNEAKCHDHNSVLTLTYDDSNLPSNGSLEPQDVTLFIKRLRKSLSPKKISYFYCGEYGENLSRPHYHLVLFGHDFSSDRQFFYKTNHVTFYNSSSLSKLWRKGHATLSDFSKEGAQYTAKYVLKKVNGKKQLSHYKLKLPEFSRMSKKPAIGKRFLEQYYPEIYDNRCVRDFQNSYKVPRYYDKWLEKHHLAIYELTKQQREAASLDFTPLTQEELTRIHQVKMLCHKTRSFELNGHSTNSELDSLIVNYYKNIGVQNV
jgi:hypothetical protein